MTSFTKGLAIVTLMVCVDKTSQTGLGEASKQSENDVETNSKRFIFGQREFHIPPDIKELLPASAIGTDHVRFDLLQLHGHKDVIKKLHSENYKFCLGCAYFDDANQCHSVEVCDNDALCINGSFPEHIHWTFPGVFQLNTDPWYGCCKPGFKCRSDDKNVTIHIANLYPVNFQYKLQTCDDLLCNAGKYFGYYVAEFRNIFNRQNVSVLSIATQNLYQTSGVVTIQSTSAISIQPTSAYRFQQSSSVNIKSTPVSQSTDSTLTSNQDQQSTSALTLASTKTIQPSSTRYFKSTSAMQLQSSSNIKLSSAPAMTISATSPHSTPQLRLQSTPAINVQPTTRQPLNIVSTSAARSQMTPVVSPSLSPAAVFTPAPSIIITQSSDTAQQQKPTQRPLPTRPPTAIKCALCSGPPEACALAYHEDYCQPPNNYCINHVTNLVNGDKLVERRCGNITNCYRDWYQGTSDNDKCRQLSSTNIMTYRFECTYCCVTDGCNVDLRPRHDTLYTVT